MGQLFCLCLLVSLFACSDGDDGEVGPQGPAGTANVIYSEWIDSELNGSTLSISQEMMLAQLSTEEYNSERDVLLVYGRAVSLAGTSTDYALPYLHTSDDEYYFFRLSSESELSVRGENTNASSFNGNFFNEFRYVIIPGGVPVGAANARGLQPDYQNMSYDEIATLFNIPE
ncbi:MAG: hypothetical protein AAF734_13025 [Bacteroidota bacterium]